MCSAMRRSTTIIRSSSAIERLADALRRRGPNYLNALQRTLGERADGTRIVLPTRAVATTDELDLGGRVLELRAWPTAHTDNDLTVLDRARRHAVRSAILRSSGTCRSSTAACADSSPSPTRSRRCASRIAIPGTAATHAWPGALAPQHALPARLWRRTSARRSSRGRRCAEAVADVGVAAAASWLLVDAFHKRNVTAAYAELEWEE